MARLALDKCLQTIEAEGGEIPLEWRIWKIELELSRKNLEGANSAAKCVFFFSFFFFSICRVPISLSIFVQRAN